MEYSTLLELISGLELGTKLHISVVFLGDHGNPMTDLPPERVIHAKAFCDRAKAMERSLLSMPQSGAGPGSADRNPLRRILCQRDL